MILRLWTALLFTLLCATVATWFIALMHDKNLRPVQDLVAFFRKQSKVGRVLLGTFFIAMWVIAGTKSGNGGGDGGGEGGGDGGGTNNLQMVIGPGNGLQPLDSLGTVTDPSGQGLTGEIQPAQGGTVGDPAPVADEWTDFTPITSPNTTRTLDGDDFRRGFVLTGIGTGETLDFSAPVDATVCDDWLAFGAAEDWIYLAFEDWAFRLGTNEVDRLRIHSDGRVEALGGPQLAAADGMVTTSAPLPQTDAINCVPPVFFPFKATLGIVPAANWHLLWKGERGMGDGNSQLSTLNPQPSLFWHLVTPSNTLQLTWQNVLLDRATNTPVSVQMEMWPSGRFAYRYDLSRLDVDEVTNILVGASLGTLDWTTNALPTNVTTLAFYPLTAEDAADTDRDGDGLSLLDELFAFGTDPELWDMDFDGVSDGDEVSVGTNPHVRDTDADGFADGTDARPLEADSWADTDGDGLPDAWRDGWFGTNATVAADGDANGDGIYNLAALMMGINPVSPPAEGFAVSHGTEMDVVTAWEIVPAAFQFSRPGGLTNLVSRTFAVNRESPWEQFFISSRPDCAAGWEMSDVLLRYGIDGEPATNAVPSVGNDSWRIPLGEAMPQTISFRLGVDGDSPSLSAPLYLLRWTPRIEFLPSENVTVISGTNGHVYAAAKRNPDTGAYCIPFRANTSGIPSKSGMDSCVAADLALSPVDGVAVSNGVPRMFMASDPLMVDLPREGTNLSKRLLLYSMEFDHVGAVSPGPRASRYADPYPLTSSALRKSFYRATGVTSDGSVTLTLSPDVPELGFIVGARPQRGGLRLLGAVAGGSRSATVMPPVSVTPTICGSPCSNYMYEVDCEYPEYHDETMCDGSLFLCPDGDDSDDCGCCGDGDASLGSFRLRIPFGESANDENLGYVWAVVDGPVAVAPAMFNVLSAQGASVVTNADGTLFVSSTARGGKALMVTNIAHGVAIPVWNESGRFESQWEVWNEGGDTSRIRVRRVTVAGNATVDETYSTWMAQTPIVFGSTNSPATVWEKSDNIRGVTRTRYEWRDGDDPAFIAEECEEVRLNGDLVRAEQRSYGKIGEGSAAQRRLAGAHGYDENGPHETVRTHWCDTDHPDRHARLRSMRSDRQPWVYFDYDTCGRETVRIEQMDGSPFPALDEVSLGASLPQDCSAKITVTGYEPQPGDDAHRNDSFEPRAVSVYVRYGANEPILISHETRLYTRETDAAGNPLRRIVKTVGIGDAVRTEMTVEYPQDSAVPSHLRGLPVYETASDGTASETTYALSGPNLIATIRRYGPSPLSQSSIPSQFPTYSVTVSDAAYRLPMREETRLSSNDALLEWSERTYDDLRRLRSVAYSDGTCETNAYSCCRLLWRRDRQGRKVLRSAQTGTDSLYNADEDVWLADVSTNGTYRIVQHHFDGFGRETDTLTHLGSTPGEATVAYTPTVEQSPSERTVAYLDGDMNGASERTDERGKVTAGSSWQQATFEQTGEDVYEADGVSGTLSTSSTRYRNGGISTERWWSGGWRRETVSVGYGGDGSRFETTTVEASDHALVTNAVVATDALGRRSSAWTPSGTTEFVYDGTSSRMLRMEFSAGQVERTSYMIHNQAGEQVGTVLDEVTNRTDVTYEELSNAWWRVTTEVTVGPNTNSVSVVKEQMTGLGGGLRGRKVSIDASGLETFTELTFNADTQIETETEVRSDGTWKTTRRKHGLVLETETAAGRTVNTYDGFGRVISVERTQGADVNLQPVSRTEYTPWGDVVAVETYTNGTDVVRESYGYDEFGNRTAVTNALGEVIESDFDAFGNVTAMRGATYPVEMEYDTENRRVALRTTRDGVTWDETRWTYDAATGNCLSKTYADNSTVTYTYTPDNLSLRTTYASGRWKENVYDERRKVVAVEYSDGEIASFDHDAFLNEIAFSNDVAAANLDRNAKGNCTNDTAAVGEEVKTTRRAFDAFSRLTEIDGTIYDYNADGLLASISNDIALVEYAYTPDHLDAGYSLTLSNGVVFTRSLLHDSYCRSLVTGISSVANGVGVGSLAYTYDALNRPTTRNNDTFGYNARGEVVFSRRGAENAEESYSYDGIGNLLLSTLNSATNTYTANNLNQYVSILRDSAPSALFAGEIISAYDLDGNMTQCGDWTYTYDGANRLKTVSSNGMLIVTNFYDAKSRRVKKVTPEATTTFFYDGWNLVEERIAYTNGTSSTIHYYWGKDLSGTLQGAGGVGGLLYLKRNGTIYVPHCDAYGNIIRYTDGTGNVVAEYVYGAFGNTLSATGVLADIFHFRYSTKFYEVETSHYYYGQRFCSPSLMRWLNRDPIEEEGGNNLYAFCGNNAVCNYDKDGCAYFAKRKLAGWFWSDAFSTNSLLDKYDIEISHEQLFFGTPNEPLDDIGYFKDGGVRNDYDRLKYEYVVTDSGYDDCIMRKAVEHVTPNKYNLLFGHAERYDNCQSYADKLKAKYRELVNDKKIKCECKNKKGK